MKYNPAEAAAAYLNTSGSFIVRNSKGDTIYSIQLNKAEVADELLALKSTGLMTQIGNYTVAINPNNIGHVFYSKDLLHFNTRDGGSCMTWEWPSADAQKLLDALGAESPAWITVPGKMGVINANALGAVRKREDTLEFQDLSGRVISTSTPLGPEAQDALLRRVNAAIKACKAVKPVTEQAAGEKKEQPAEKPTKEERQRLKDLFNTLKSAVFGQDKPLEALTRAVRRARAGLQEENKPMGSFLFLGPTGVGKTEAARQLAKALGYEFKKFDMSEYMAKWDVSRFTGGSPNYVGYEDGGHLTNFVSKNPKSVLLFDEIEKAHPDVANILLQVMDDAQLTDGKGRTVKFRDTIIILTSNLGTGYTQKQPIGFVPAAARTAEDDPDAARTSDEVKKFFLAEFVNRLTDVVRFNPLSPEIMLQMVDKFVSELSDRMKKQDAELTVTPAARKHLAETGYSEDFGARPLKREIEKATDRLADEILFGSLQDGGTAVIDVETSGKSKKLVHRFNDAANDNTPQEAPETVPVSSARAARTPAPAA